MQQYWLRQGRAKHDDRKDPKRVFYAQTYQTVCQTVNQLNDQLSHENADRYKQLQ
jgi:hypothetical protein